MHVSELQSIDEAVDVMDDFAWYGIDQRASAPIGNGLSTVEINNTDLAIDNNVRDQLSQIKPLVESSSFVTDIYLYALE